jgi:hypothetical protein
MRPPTAALFGGDGALALRLGGDGEVWGVA